jgi:vinculin
MVNQAKQVALNPRDTSAANRWRDVNDELLNAVRSVGDAITGVTPSQLHHHPAPLNHAANSYSQPQPLYSSQQSQRQQSSTPLSYQPTHSILESVAARAPGEPIVHNRVIVREEIPAPPRPPPVVEISPAPRGPPPPEVDEEEETRAFWERYPLPGASGILTAAHNLHQELRQWSSQENEIVAAAKRMAILMARLSQLVRGEGGTKKDLIDCAKAIADSSEEVTRLAVQLARQCTDIKMRVVSFKYFQTLKSTI